MVKITATYFFSAFENPILLDPTVDVDPVTNTLYLYFIDEETLLGVR